MRFILHILITILMAAPAYSIPEGKLLLSDNFDGSTSGKAVSVSFAPGKDGQAVVLDTPQSTVEIPAEYFSSRAGCIEFDVKLLKPLSENKRGWALLSDVGCASSFPGAINVHWLPGKTELEWGIFDGANHNYCHSKNVEWVPDRWYHVVLSYGPQGLSLKVDGKAEDMIDYAGGLANTVKKIGFYDGCFDSPPVAIDNLRTYLLYTYGLKLSQTLIHPNRDGLFDVCNVEYEVPQSGDLVIDVLDPENKPVKTLVDRRVEKEGEYSFSWDGSGLPDGQYTVRLAAGGQELKSKVWIDGRWKWAKPGRAQQDFYPTGVFYFWEDDVEYLRRHVDDPERVKNYYETTLKDIAQHGANLVQYSPPKDHMRIALDAAQKNSLKAILSVQDITNIIHDPGAFTRANPFDVVSNAVKDVKDHPALAGYYVVDEPGNTPEVAARIATIKKVLEAVDPKHHAYSVLLGAYADTFKIVDYQTLLVDPYFAAAVHQGDWTGYLGALEYAKKAAGGKPVWVTVQAFGSKVWVTPTPEELRAMVWVAIANGAKGVMYFLYQSTTEVQGECLQGLVGTDLKPKDGRWDEARRINADINKLAPVLLKLKPAEFTVPFATKSIVAKPFEDSMGTRYIMLVNTNTVQAVIVPLCGVMSENVLTGVSCGEWISLEPGAGKLLRLQ